MLVFGKKVKKLFIKISTADRWLNLQRASQRTNAEWISHLKASGLNIRTTSQTYIATISPWAHQMLMLTKVPSLDDIYLWIYLSLRSCMRYRLFCSVFLFLMCTVEVCANTPLELCGPPNDEIFIDVNKQSCCNNQVSYGPCCINKPVPENGGCCDVTAYPENWSCCDDGTVVDNENTYCP